MTHPTELSELRQKSIADQLIEIIKKLPVAQQEALLEAANRMFSDSRQHARIDYHTEIAYSDEKKIAQGYT